MLSGAVPVAVTSGWLAVPDSAVAGTILAACGGGSLSLLLQNEPIMGHRMLRIDITEIKENV
jgi:hypothetical protein